ncbi:MAG TPA: nicotinate-nucleotide adenylyltransferase, partial [Desulfobacteraceae bacterium]|nr:nicotinate-nucleotide adenylyltransferase [Desulfobacteraceae bacterium]HPQ27349.1 nicotinate-nucleotide adenylyltransferase [Desulfobacteraceae bacterium]
GRNLLKLGILGGTFDPVHLGHLRSAEEIGQKLQLDKVYLIPSSFPPHKKIKNFTSFDHRFNMVRLAIDDSSLLDALDLEAKRPGFSYSIETLREFHNLFSPDPDLFFILGIDAFLDIKTWKEYKRLFDYAHFVVIERPGYSSDLAFSQLCDLIHGIEKTHESHIYKMPSGRSLIFMTPTLLDISSTGIRKMIANGESIRFLVPESVRIYINEKGLYGENAIC